MIDKIFFYSVNDGNIFISGVTCKNTTKFSPITYEYNNPFDDSCIVDSYNNEFGNLFICPSSLFFIIRKAKFPHFMKLDENGITYIIKIDYLSEQQSNNLLAQYQDDYYEKNAKPLRWTSIKWFNIDNIMKHANELSDDFLSLVKKHNIINLLGNNVLIRPQRVTTKCKALLIKLINIKRAKKLSRTIQNKQNKDYFDLLAKYFKTYTYDQILSIYDYTNTDALRINSALRYLLRFGISTSPTSPTSPTLASDLSKAKTLAKIISGAPKRSQVSEKYLSLFRGLSFDPKLANGQLTTIFKYSFNSTSTDIGIASNMFVPTDGCLFKLIVPSDTQLIALNAISHYSYENEILLPPGLVFRVIRKTTYYNKLSKSRQKMYTVVLTSNTNTYLNDIDNLIKSLGKSKSHNKPLSPTVIKKINVALSKMIKKGSDSIIDPCTNISYKLSSVMAKLILYEKLLDIKCISSINDDNIIEVIDKYVKLVSS